MKKMTIEQMAELICQIEKKTLDPKYRSDVIKVDDVTLRVKTHYWMKAVAYKELLDHMEGFIITITSNNVLEIIFY